MPRKPNARIAHGNTEQGDETDERSEGQRTPSFPAQITRQKHREHTADQRERKVGQDEQQVAPVAKHDGEQQQETNCHRKAEPAGKRVERRRDVYSGGRR